MKIPRFLSPAFALVSDGKVLKVLMLLCTHFVCLFIDVFLPGAWDFVAAALHDVCEEFVAKYRPRRRFLIGNCLRFQSDLNNSLSSRDGDAATLLDAEGGIRSKFFVHGAPFFLLWRRSNLTCYPSTPVALAPALASTPTQPSSWANNSRGAIFRTATSANLAF